MVVELVRLSDSAIIPEYKTEGAAGCDFYADENMEIANVPRLVSTGIAMAIPEGYCLEIRSRSGKALNGIVVTNSPGTVDSDYRGEIKIMLHHVCGHEWVRKGERIAQGVLVPVKQMTFKEVKELPPTDRDTKGFGSTGS